jgi:hypothetical protein
LRFDIVNLFDTIYAIRDGGGIGVFAPQFGQRRGYFAESDARRTGFRRKADSIPMIADSR